MILTVGSKWAALYAPVVNIVGLLGIELHVVLQGLAAACGALLCLLWTVALLHQHKVCSAQSTRQLLCLLL